jgi:hypothetical protein
LTAEAIWRFTKKKKKAPTRTGAHWQARPLAGLQGACPAGLMQRYGHARSLALQRPALLVVRWC